jgi:hypothetical protein
MIVMNTAIKSAPKMEATVMIKFLVEVFLAIAEVEAVIVTSALLVVDGVALNEVCCSGISTD